MKTKLVLEYGPGARSSEEQGLFVQDAAGQWHKIPTVRNLVLHAGACVPIIATVEIVVDQVEVVGAFLTNVQGIPST